MTNEKNPERTADAARPPRPKLRVTPRALLEVKGLSDPKLHPDGQRVAFVVEEADFDDSRVVSHLWLTEWLRPTSEEDAEPDGEEESNPLPTATIKESLPPEDAEEIAEEPQDPTRQLTYSHDGEFAPDWSPDGRYLAFLSSRFDPSEPDDEDEDADPQPQVWILPIDGGEARKVTATKEGVIAYAWTPDSASIVYLSPETRPAPIESVRKDDRNRRHIDPIVDLEDRLRRQFWRVDVEEKKPKLLFTADYGVQEFALSPDGNRICYATNYSGEWNDYHLVDLWVRDLTDGAAFKLLERPGGKTHPRWSPESDRVAFLSWLDPQLSYSTQTLFVAPAASDVASIESAIQPYDPSFDFDLTCLEWSRHDGNIYAIAAVHTGSEAVCFHEGKARVLEANGSASREDIGVDPGGSALVMVVETAEALPEIVLRDEDGQMHVLTKLNADFTENYRLPRQEVVRWNSADGMAIEGILTYPLDYEPGYRVPLVVQIHGGPKGQSKHTLQSYSMHPVWSAEGYAVLRPNFRGSEGYGNAFAVANRRDLGGGDFNDIMTGVDWCIAQGIADPEQLGVMGGSYGGYMTNWAIGHTDRFKAAISMFGIFHLQTDYSNSDLSRWDNDYLGAYYWEDPEIYRRLSPGSYLEQIRTPTLILHGEEDTNTHLSNSKELYQALKHRGVITQFVRYPREGHGLGEPNHRLDEMRRSLAWMDTYVRPASTVKPLPRIGDKVSFEGLELMIVRAEIATMHGQPKSANDDQATVFLEVAFTLQHTQADIPAAPISLSLQEVKLNLQSNAETVHLHPIGVPLDLPGGKVLVEGDALRIVQHPDSETGQLAFPCAVVFRIPKTCGDAKLNLLNFPSVALVWTADVEAEESSHEADAKVD